MHSAVPAKSAIVLFSTSFEALLMLKSCHNLLTFVRSTVSSAIQRVSFTLYTLTGARASSVMYSHPLFISANMLGSTFCMHVNAQYIPYSTFRLFISANVFGSTFCMRVYAQYIPYSTYRLFFSFHFIHSFANQRVSPSTPRAGRSEIDPCSAFRRNPAGGEQELQVWYHVV